MNTYTTELLKTGKTLLFAALFCCAGYQGYATAWTTGTAGDISTLANWTNGSASPTTFATPGDTWTINLAMTLAASSWTVGTAASTLDTVTFATGGSIAMTGAGSTFTITIYGDVLMTGGTLTLGGAGTSAVTNIYGTTYVSAGTGAFNTNGAGSGMIINTYGNYNMTGGSVVTGGASGTIGMNINGNFNMSGGVINADGASCVTTLKIYGNGSFSGASAITNTGASCSSFVHFSLPSASGTMIVDNTSTGTWSATEAYIDTNCTAQLDNNFSTDMGAAGFPSTTYGLTVDGTLICPAAYTVNGTNFFILNGVATLEVAATTGINGAITTTGTKTFATTANYVFNGTAAQVTGSYLPASLASPDTITINNSAGVTLSQSTLTTGTLLFTSGILSTGTFTMSVPGAATAVTGAGAASYVNGTLIKTISGLTSVNYEVGDVDYAPMELSLSSAGTGGSLGLKVTSGLHPSVATSGLSTAAMANHYWTVSNYAATGPVTITPTATYNAGDILGGSNASFVTQEYASGAWLGSYIATTNTASPYTSSPTTAIAESSVAGDYIFGNVFCGTLPIAGTASVCAGASTALTDATAGGVWSSSAPAIATISATGNVSGVAGGTAIITYTEAGCTVTDVFTVNPLPNAGTIGVSYYDTVVCLTLPDALTDPVSGGVWSSFNTALATVGSSTGIVTGVAAGIDTIFYLVTNGCGTDTAKLRVRVQSLAACREGVSSQPGTTTTELKIFPNPNTGTFSMNLSSAADEEVHVVIMNITGIKVKELNTTTNKATDIQLDPVAGIYLISATKADGQYFARVIVE